MQRHRFLNVRRKVRKNILNLPDLKNSSIRARNCNTSNKSTLFQLKRLPCFSPTILLSIGSPYPTTYNRLCLRLQRGVLRFSNNLDVSEHLEVTAQSASSLYLFGHSLQSHLPLTMLRSEGISLGLPPPLQRRSRSSQMDLLRRARWALTLFEALPKR